MTATLPAGIAELMERPQWIVWRPEAPAKPGDKPRKVPYAPRTMRRASTTNPDDWASVDEAMAACPSGGEFGLGYVFADDDPYTGIDLDKCRDPQSGHIEPWAWELIRRLDSYTEISPSGTGVHIIVRGELPPGRRRTGTIEMYCAERYFTVTVLPLPRTRETIEDRGDVLAALHAELFPPELEQAPREPSAPVTLDDTALIEKMLGSRQGAKLSQLWAGSLAEFDEDHSAADLSLCDALAWWTNGDAARMDSLFRLSGLRRPKWDERRGQTTYGQRTIIKALGRLNGGYTGKPQPKPTALKQETQVRTETVAPLSAEEIIGPTPSVSGFRWPALPEAGVYYGLAGEFVKLIDPHTEADPIALLVQFLVAYGNVIGRSAHFVAEADKHYTNLYAVLIGETAKGRKGSSLGQVRRVMGSVAPTWSVERIQDGQSSGEGLIWAVRDEIHKKVAVLNKGRPTGDYRDDIVDDGISDKRLLCAESEFATLLRVLEREGNTLSAVLRQAWDTGILRSLTKNNPAKATGAHISEIGHITADELHRYLMRTEVANGLGNRFLWICVRRSKVLPDGGHLESVDFGGFCRELQMAIDFGASQGEMVRDEPARQRWHEVYPDLSEGRPGMSGALLARAEAQVMRLATVYALLDLSPRICLPHLEAALALWRYVEASVRAVFGDAVGDPVADTILDTLRLRPEGMTRTDINRLFSGNRSADTLSRALALLRTRGLVEMTEENTGGRPTETYRLA